MQYNQNSIDEYIARFPSDTRVILERLHQTIKQVMPDAATETISYGVPTFKLNGAYVIYFGGYPHHVSVYPLPVDEQLRKKIEPHVAGKGTLRFPLSQPIPYDLVKRVAQALLKDHSERTGKINKGYVRRGR